MASSSALAGVSIVRTSTPVYYFDSGVSFTGAYASYQITNTGATAIPDAWVTATNFTGGVVQLAPSETGINHLGTLAAGASKTAYFYLQGSAVTSTAQSHTITVYSGRPTSGTSIGSQAFSFSSVSSTIQASANKVSSISMSTASPSLGGLITITVTGDTGTMNTPAVMALTPATDPNWPANAFQLESVSVSLSGANTGTYTDTLYLAPANSAATTYAATYTFRVTGTTSTSTPVSPIGYISSGSQIKHTVQSSISGLAPVPPASNTVTLGMSVNPASSTAGGTPTYTLTVNNVGSSDVSLEDFVDTLPSTPAAATYVSGSSTWGGSAISDAAILGNQLTWTGTFTVPGNSSRALNFKAQIPSVNGTYNNSAIAHVMSAQVDTSLSTSDSSPATTGYTVGIPDLSITSLHSGSFALGQTGATYTLTASNIGAGATSGTVSVVDTLPSGMTATGMSGTGWICVLNTLTCTRADALAAGTSYPAITLTVTVASNAASSLTNTVAVSGGGESNTSNDTATDATVVSGVPDLTAGLTHSGSFTQSQSGTYTISVSNSGTAATSGSVSVVNTLPSGLTASAMSGTGWTCTLNTVTCARSDALAPGAAYPGITLTVNVASDATGSVTDSVAVSGGGESNTSNNTATDATTITGVSDMAVSSTHSGTFTQGQSGTYTITVTNSGTGVTSGTVTLADTLPSGLTATAMSGTGWTCALNTATCTRSDALASGGSYPAITLTVSVAANATGSLTNSVSVSGGGEINTANNMTTDATTIAGVSDLTVAVAHSGTFTQGQSGTFTLTINNSGTAATSGAVSVVDALPSGLAATAMSGTGWTCTLNTATCTRSDALANGASYPAISLTVSIASNASGSLTNTASVSGGAETNTANNTGTDAVTISGLPDLTVTSTHSGSFIQGQSGTYTITVSNSGTAATSGVVSVVDTLPSGLTATAMSGIGWTCTLNTATCTRSDALANGASYPAISLTVSVASNAAGSLSNTATVSGGGEANSVNDIGSDATVISGVPDLTVTSTHSGSFTQGQSGTYTITVANSGTAATSGVVSVVDALPSGLTATGMSGTGWTCTANMATCTRTDALIQGASYPAITLTVSVASNSTGSLTNTVTVSGGGETNTTNNTGTDAVTISGVPDLTITSTHTGSFTQGQSGTYSITVSNSGTAATSGVVSGVDTLPSGLTATAMSGTGWTCTANTATCTRSDALASGASFPAITLTVNVAVNASGSLTNTAAVSGGGEINTANNTATDPTTVSGVPDLTVSSSHTGTFTQGQSGTFTITVTNSGTAATSGTVSLIDTLPNGLTATAMSGSGWTCALNTLTCTRADVWPNGSSFPSITLTVAVAPTATGSLTNTATVSGGGETNVANNTGTDSATSAGVPDITVTSTHTGSFTQGQTGTYTITVSNTGTAITSAPVSVVDVLPSGLTATAMSGSGWSCTLNTATCTRSDALANGSPYPTITLTVAIASNAAGSLTNTVTASGGGETNTSNNTATDATSVSGVPDVTVTSTHSGSFTQGQTGTYTITISNPGTAATNGVVSLVDTLPTGLTATAMSGTGWSCTLNTATCTRSDILANGTSFPNVTLTVAVASNATGSLTNSVAVSGGGETNTSNNTATDATSISGVPDVVVTSTHSGSFTQGQTGTYTITVSNTGTAATSGLVSLVDTLPTGLTATAMNGTGWNCTLNTATCTRSDALTNGSSYPNITLNVTVASNAAGSLSNTVTVAGGGEANTSNNTATEATGISGVPDVTVSSTHTGSFIQAQTGTYTVTVSNTGTAATSGAVSLVETLPTGLTATAISGTGWNCTLNSVTCTRSDALANGNSYPVITVTVTVASNATGSLSSTATVSGGGEVNAANNSATEATTIGGVSDLTATLAHSGSFTQGQTGTYTVTVGNSGTAPTSGVVSVVDALPSGLTAGAMTGNGWTCTLNTTTCTRSDVLANGSSYPSITLTVNVAANATGSLTNTATVSGGGEMNTANDTATDATSIGGVPDLTASVTHAGTFTQAGTGTYTITVANSGTASTSGVVSVVDTLPTGLTAGSLSGNGWTCTLNTGTCTRSDVLASGSSYPAITVTVNVAAAATGSLTNTATVSGGGETNTVNNVATISTAVATVPDLTISVTRSGRFSQGQTGTFTVVATNIGTVATNGVVSITQNLSMTTAPSATSTSPSAPRALAMVQSRMSNAQSQGYTVTALSGTGWACTISTLTCTRSDVLSSGAAYPPITLAVAIAADATGSLSNDLAVAGGGETNISNNNGADQVAITGSPALSVSITPIGHFVRGGNGDLNVSIANSGTGSSAGPTTIRLTFGSGMTVISASGLSWTCQALDPQDLECTRPDGVLQGSSLDPIAVVTGIAVDSPTNVPVTAKANESAQDGESAQPVIAMITPDPLPTLGLKLMESVDRSFAEVGDVLTYSATVQNPSNYTVDSAQLQVTLPAGFAYVPQTARLSNGTAGNTSLTPVGTGSSLSLPLPAMLANGSLTVLYRARLTPRVPNGQISDTLLVTGKSKVASVQSAKSSQTVTVMSSLLSTRQVIVGLVYLDKNGNDMFDAGDEPLPDVRLYLSTGQYVRTDSHGLYNFPSVSGGSALISIEPRSLPAGLRLEDEHAGNWSKLLRTPLGGGAMLRQNFALVSTITTAERKGIAESAAAEKVKADEVNTDQEPVREGSLLAPAPGSSIDKDAVSLRFRTNPESSIRIAVNGHPVATRNSGEYESATVPVNLKVGPNSVQVLMEDQQGQTTSQDYTVYRSGPVVRLAMSTSSETVDAGSAAPVIIAVRTFDKWGQAATRSRVNLSTSAGGFASRAAKAEAPERNTAMPGNSLLPNSASATVGNGMQFEPSVPPAETELKQVTVDVIDGSATVRLRASEQPATAHIQATLDEGDASVGAKAEVAFNPPKLNGFLVGMGELTVGRAAPKAGVFGQTAAVQGEGSLFYQNTILPETNLTVAYDSSQSLNSATGVPGMFTLDPLNRVYPVFGDSSQQGYAAPANSKLFARVDHHRSYLMFGDIRDEISGEPQNAVAEFARNITGVKAHVEKNSDTFISVMAARPNTAFGRDVVPGSSLGLIQLTHGNLLAGSETVVIETRDRRNPELILSQQPLVRNVDYNINPFSGTVMLMRTISQFDESFNLNQIVFTYEYQATTLSSGLYSVRTGFAMANLGTRIQSSFLNDNSSGTGSYFLGSLQVDQKLASGGHLTAVLPVSYGNAVGGNSLPVSGGASAIGTAWRAQLEQPFGFWRGKAGLNFSKTSDSFSAPFAQTVVPGSEIINSYVNTNPLSASRLRLMYTSERNSTSNVNNGRQTEALKWTQSLRETLDVTLGLDHRDYTNHLVGQDISSTMVEAGLDWRITSRLQATVKREENLGAADPTYPNQTLFSSRYKLNADTALFFNERLASAPIVPIADVSQSGFASVLSQRETAIGVDSRLSKYTSLTSSYRLESGINSTDSFAVLGFMNRVPVRPDLSLDFGLEHGARITGKSGDYNSATLGFGYTPTKHIRTATHYEFRDRQGSGTILTTGLAGKLTESWTALGRFQYANTNFLGQSSRAQQGTAAMAVRPHASDRAGLLFSYTLTASSTPGFSAPTGAQSQRVGILSSDSYLQPWKRLELYQRFALSDRAAGSAGFATITTETYLSQSRAQFRLAKRLDTAIEARRLWQPSTGVTQSVAAGEMGLWLLPSLRTGLGYNARSADAIGPNFLTGAVNRGFYFVLTTKLSSLFDLFGPSEMSPLTSGPRAAAGGVAP